MEDLLKKKLEKMKLISFNQAKEGIAFSFISDSVNKPLILLRNIVSFLAVLLEVLIASSFSGWLVRKPLCALFEWLIVLSTIMIIFRFIVKGNSRKYLLRYYSCCSIITSVCFLIFSIGSLIILLSFSGEISKQYFWQIVAQVGLSILGVCLIMILMIKYVDYLVKKELSAFFEDVRLPIFGKILDKIMVYGSVLILIGMQFYRFNKFWILSDSSWFSTILIPISQVLVFIFFVCLVIYVLFRVFYPNFIKYFLIEKYSEKFREEYGYSKSEWYD